MIRPISDDSIEGDRRLLGADCPTLEKIIVFDKIAVIEKRPEVMYFDDFLAMGRQADRIRKWRSVLPDWIRKICPP